MENKKTKLTISGKLKKNINDFDDSKSRGKKTVVIDKYTSKTFGKVANNKTSGFRQSPNFKKGTSVIKLPCSHQYHSSCIKKWFQDSSNKCCICKKEVVKAKYKYLGVSANSEEDEDTLNNVD